MPASGNDSIRTAVPPSDFASDGFGPLTREELLGGLPARRASTLLFAIESRTAHLVARSRRAMAQYETERTAEEQERAFLDALAQGRDLPLQPTIQDLERYAPEWAALVPDDDALRAAVARMVGEKYLLPTQHVPGIRAALDLESAGVARAFERLHGRPLASVYAQQIPRSERLRWHRSRSALRLETLPPFWTAFALTLTETVGAGILALPIALAGIGPLPGLVVLIVLGLVNVLTIAAIAEAAARNGNVRYGQAYFARLVADNLGRPAAWILNVSLVALALFLAAYFIGLSSTLADATHVPMEVCAIIVVLVILAVLHRESLDATVASALVIGVVSIGIIGILSLIALTSIDSANLRHVQVPFIDGEPFDSSVLELIFGVVLLAYFGHTSAGNCAAVVLGRDPSARSLIRGSVAAMLTAVGLYGLWVVAVNGAVAPDEMANETGTALIPLAAEIGPVILILGSVFVVLAMGMASIHMALSLFNQTREWLRPLTAGAAGPRAWRSVAASREGRFWLSAAPIVAIFIGVEALMLTDRESFTEPLGFLGTVTAPVLAGIFPMLMIVAARRKGDCAIGPVWRMIGHPFAVAVVTLLFLGALVLHGTVIWESPLQRVIALLTALASVAVAALAWRRGAFRPRTVVEVQIGSDAGKPPAVNVVECGRSAPAAVRFLDLGADDPARIAGGGAASPGGFRPTLIDLPPSSAPELKVWAHRITPEGESERLLATLKIMNGGMVTEYDLGALGGYVIVPVTDSAQQIEITPNR